MSHIFITGASSGIGAALARQRLAAGHKVTAVARRRERLDEIGEGHDRFFAAEGDVTDEVRMAELVGEAGRLGPVDIAIMNAGIYIPQDSRQIDPAVYAQHMDVNYMGVINSLASIVPMMMERKSGQIAIVSSVAVVARPSKGGGLWFYQGGFNFSRRISCLRPCAARY